MKVRAGAVVPSVVVAGLATLTLWHAPAQLSQLKSDVEVGGRSELHRRLQPARTVGLGDPSFFVAVERIIPPEARYAVMTGAGAGVSDRMVLRWVRRFARYWLLPRRLTRPREGAEWILAYGVDPRSSSLRLARVIPVGPGVSVAEVARP